MHVANVGDATVSHGLLHGKEECMPSHAGADSWLESQDSKALHFVAKKLGKVNVFSESRDRRSTSAGKAAKPACARRLSIPAGSPSASLATLCWAVAGRPRAAHRC